MGRADGTLTGGAEWRGALSGPGGGCTLAAAGYGVVGGSARLPAAVGRGTSSGAAMSTARLTQLRIDPEAHRENVSVLRDPRVPREGSAELPALLTPLVGREREIAAVCGLLRGGVRLLVLTGPGGVGKTRLAVDVAATLRAEFADGVGFVSLAPIMDPSLVPSVIGRSLGLREANGRSPADQLTAYLHDQQLLLVLDNFEQVAEAALDLVELLVGSPRLTTLVTSRTSLRVSGARQFAVPPLELPKPGQPPTAEALARSAAAALFIQRASEVKSDFAVTPTTAAAVADICRRLDGLPLAIELAAAWTRVLPPPALLTRLEQRLPLLTGGGPDLPRRQRTLRATIAWSYSLLGADEQTLFRRLAVFVGGCTLAAAEAVVSSRGEGVLPYQSTPAPLEPSTPLLDSIATLVDQNLMQRVDEADGDDATSPRFGMLETIREFGLEQLTASGADEAEMVRRAHATWCMALATRAGPELHGPAQHRWGRCLETEHANLRAALS